ncbi:hypothetical protein PI124_g4960 [Phytophthora idaei]|nr:hypothetical protein PI125_g4542 [Phytophthora idaei]KAG3159836.1 hypothetical protein PI126_g7193 [Phytophthora idaei]KAG3250399.1 hypothetical protein PI124_g4960 [Phytophthora idaei]
MPLVVPIPFGIRRHLSRADLFAAHVAVAGKESYVAETEEMMNKCRKVVLKLFNTRFSELEKSEHA